jgi:hypothetical protein
MLEKEGPESPLLDRSNAAVIKCPVMAHPISTGVEVNSDAEFHSLLDITYHVDCPLCGGSHKWTRLDAWIPDPPSPARKSDPP